MCSHKCSSLWSLRLQTKDNCRQGLKSTGIIYCTTWTKIVPSVNPTQWFTLNPPATKLGLTSDTAHYLQFTMHHISNVLDLYFWWSGGKSPSDSVETDHLDFFVVFFFTASTALSAAFERRGDLTGLVVAFVSCFLLLSFVGLFVGLSSFSTTFPGLTPARFITDDQHAHSPENHSRNSIQSEAWPAIQNGSAKSTMGKCRWQLASAEFTFTSIDYQILDKKPQIWRISRG